MENFENSQNEQLERLKNKFEYYLGDFPLSDEDLHKSLLDVGAGRGEFVQYLREIIGNKEAVGVESQGINPGTEGIVKADGLHLPFGDNSFEIVTAHNYLPIFLDNAAEVEAAILELLRVTKTGGKMMGDIETPESIESSETELKTNLGEKYNEKMQEIYLNRIHGAESLQNFLRELQKSHKVEILRPKSETTVVVVYK